MMLFSTVLTSSFAAETDVLTKSSVNEMLQYEFSSEVMSPNPYNGSSYQKRTAKLHSQTIFLTRWSNGFAS
ncbi:hypothetical protein FPS98_17805 [Brevibacillus brevis]|uniref:Uncharacterized protein n=1 Tax=Brevibacillus brevis TaxID=1393 RepID=A0A517IA11_BREBE|nr:hypothetical protein FPS98_17805 [Brevibacillus brevis]